MRTTKMNFEEVSIKATRKFSDPETGKRRQETRKFFQTINPFNRNVDGAVKSRDEIMKEITADAIKWSNEK